MAGILMIALVVASLLLVVVLAVIFFALLLSRRGQEPPSAATFLSPDGNWRWDGTQWHPAGRAAGPPTGRLG